MVEEGEGDEFPLNETLDMISNEEITTNVGNENDANHEACRARNRRRTARRRNVNERHRRLQWDLDAEFAAAGEQGFRTPVANIARVTAILEGSRDPVLQQALRLAQRAWLQLDRQNPSATVREEQVGKSHSQVNISRTLGGHPCQHPNRDNIRPQGSKATGGRPWPPPGGNPR